MLAWITAWRWAMLVATVGWVAVVLTRTDPGITSDEPFSVVYGIEFVQRFVDQGGEFFSEASLGEAFATRSEHPPLGRWIIGWTHRLWNWGAVSGETLTVQDILDARVAPATAYALILLLVTRSVEKRHGRVGGLAAGVSLLLMPRVFADAHFAALETFVSCTYLMAVLSAAWMMEAKRPWLVAPVAGFVLGLALLTKMHGLFVLPLACVWAIVVWRFRAIPSLFLWAICGVLVFFVGWQWLWSDWAEFVAQWRDGLFSSSGFIARLPHIFAKTGTYLSSSLDRDTIYVTYGGWVYRDSEVPWHYPWVMFAVTVPVGLHLLGLLGSARQAMDRRRDARGWLILCGVLFPLCVFSVPRVPIYDGTRLFAMVFPLWGMLAGQGAAWTYAWLLQRWSPAVCRTLIAAVLLCQSLGVWYYHPFQLSYYNLLIGGLPGAARAGFEVTYWGDSVTRELVDRWSEVAPARSCAVLVPSLYTGQGSLYESASVTGKAQRIVGSLKSSCPYLIVYNRQAYLGEVAALVHDPARRPIAEHAVHGVWLSRVYLRGPRTERDKHDAEGSEAADANSTREADR